MRLRLGKAEGGIIANNMSGCTIRDRVVDGQPSTAIARNRIGVSADHGGFELMEQLSEKLRMAGYEVVNFGSFQLNKDDDYPDFVIPLAQAVSCGEVQRGVAICGSGVGASVVANKVAGVRACLIHDDYSAHQGVEDDDLNIICLGGLVIGHSLAWELVETFLNARFSGEERHRRRLAKIQDLEDGHWVSPNKMDIGN